MDAQDNLSEEFILVDLILAHNKVNAQKFLKDNGFHSSGTKEDIRRRLRDLIKEGSISGGHLVELLDGVEGYGKQHVYLFKIPDAHLDQLRSEEYVTSLLKSLELYDLYNKFKSFIPSDQPEIASITHNNDWIKIRWVSKKEKLELVEEIEEEDEELREFIIKKYLRRILRATTLFQVSLLNGSAELFIPNGLNYEEEKTKYLQQLNKWFRWGILDSYNLYSAISKIEGLDETRLRSIGIKTVLGSSIDISSPSNSQGIWDDSDASNVKGNIKTGVSGKGNFYWLQEKAEGILSRDFHTIVYGDRIAITRECHAEEINYVLGRIRNFIE